MYKLQFEQKLTSKHMYTPMYKRITNHKDNYFDNKFCIQILLLRHFMSISTSSLIYGTGEQFMVDYVMIVYNQMSFTSGHDSYKCKR